MCCAALRPMTISIHAPREGGDDGEIAGIFADGISIHAPREGGDPQYFPSFPLREDFNPRPPRGGRRPTAFLCCFLF